MISLRRLKISMHYLSKFTTNNLNFCWKNFYWKKKKRTLGILLVIWNFPTLLLQLYARPGILKVFREDLLFDLLRLRSYVQARLILCEVNFEVKPPFALSTGWLNSNTSQLLCDARHTASYDACLLNIPQIVKWPSTAQKYLSAFAGCVVRR